MKRYIFAIIVFIILVAGVLALLFLHPKTKIRLHTTIQTELDFSFELPRRFKQISSANTENDLTPQYFLCSSTSWFDISELEPCDDGYQVSYGVMKDEPINKEALKEHVGVEPPFDSANSIELALFIMQHTEPIPQIESEQLEIAGQNSMADHLIFHDIPLEELFFTFEVNDQIIGMWLSAWGNETEKFSQKSQAIISSIELSD